MMKINPVCAMQSKSLKTTEVNLQKSRNYASLSKNEQCDTVTFKKRISDNATRGIMTTMLGGTGALIGLIGGPVTAAVGAVIGAVVGLFTAESDISDYNNKTGRYAQDANSDDNDHMYSSVNHLP